MLISTAALCVWPPTTKELGDESLVDQKWECSRARGPEVLPDLSSIGALVLAQTANHPLSELRLDCVRLEFPELRDLFGDDLQRRFIESLQCFRVVVVEGTKLGSHRRVQRGPCLLEQLVVSLVVSQPRRAGLPPGRRGRSGASFALAKSENTSPSSATSSWKGVAVRNKALRNRPSNTLSHGACPKRAGVLELVRLVHDQEVEHWHELARQHEAGAVDCVAYGRGVLEGLQPPALVQVVQAGCAATSAASETRFASAVRPSLSRTHRETSRCVTSTRSCSPSRKRAMIAFEVCPWSPFQ